MFERNHQENQGSVNYYDIYNNIKYAISNRAINRLKTLIEDDKRFSTEQFKRFEEYERKAGDFDEARLSGQLDAITSNSDKVVELCNAEKWEEALGWWTRLERKKKRRDQTNGQK